MTDETVLRQKAREAIQAGRLPSRSPDQVWGGPGTGAQCVICGASTKRSEVELEIEFTEHSNRATYLVHLRCFSILESERQNAPSASAELPASDAEVMSRYGTASGT